MTGRAVGWLWDGEDRDKSAEKSDAGLVVRRWRCVRTRAVRPISAWDPVVDQRGLPQTPNLAQIPVM